MTILIKSHKTKCRVSRHWEYKRKKEISKDVVEVTKDCIKYLITRTIEFNLPGCDPGHRQNKVIMSFGTLLSVLKIPNQGSLQVPRLIHTIDPVPWLTQMACREPNRSWLLLKQLDYLSRVSCPNRWITCPGVLTQIVGLLVQGFLPESCQDWITCPGFLAQIVWLLFKGSLPD